MEMGLFGKSKKEKASRRQKNTAVVPDLYATANLAAWLEKIQPTQRSHSAHASLLAVVSILIVSARSLA